MEDQQLIEICNKIYHKHQKALDLIFENKTDGNASVYEYVINAIRSNQKIIPRDEQKRSFMVFYTKRMNDYLGTMSGNSSWGDNYSYKYWISMHRDNKTMLGHFELGGYNLNDEMVEKHQKIIEILKPKDSRKEDYRYKRVYKTKAVRFSENDEEDDIKKKADSIIKELLDMEEDLFKKL